MTILSKNTVLLHGKTNFIDLKKKKIKPYTLLSKLPVKFKRFEFFTVNNGAQK